MLKDITDKNIKAGDILRKASVTYLRASEGWKGVYDLLYTKLIPVGVEYVYSKKNGKFAVYFGEIYLDKDDKIIMRIKRSVRVG